jgi:hypothetical protein
MPLSRERRNETDLLHLGGGKWLSVERYKRSQLFIHHSEDDARTWRRYPQPPGWKQARVPGELEQLADGTILLSRGKRGAPPKGVEVLFSGDAGRTWTEAFRLLDTKANDFGYPSSIQRQDGMVVTAFYEGIKANAQHLGPGKYHMGVVIWDPQRTRAQ